MIRENGERINHYVVLATLAALELIGLLLGKASALAQEAGAKPGFCGNRIRIRRYPTLGVVLYDGLKTVNLHFFSPGSFKCPEICGAKRPDGHLIANELF